MKKYNEFLLESLRPGTTKITLKDAYNIMKDNCTEFIENPMNIFKGATIDLKHYTFDPKQFNRPPMMHSVANLLYHWIFNNSKYWQDYPKRSEGVIASLSVLTAQGYGHNIFNVIPFDGSNWGICPDPDIWASFDRVDDLVDFSNDIVDYVKVEFNFHPKEYTFSNFIDFLKSVNKDNFVEGNLLSRFEDFILPLLETKKNLYDVIEELLRPNMNNFMHLDYEEMFINFGEDKTSEYNLKQHGREVWTDSKCLYIPRVERGEDYKTNKEFSDFMILMRKLGIDQDKINLLQNIY